MPGSIKKWSKKFIPEARGSFAINFSLMLPVLLGLAAGATDFTVYNQQKASMQEAADAAAIAAVREANLKGWSHDLASSIAEAVVDSNYAHSADNRKYHTTSAVPDESKRKITVMIKQDHYPYFSASIFPSPQIEVSATAVSFGSSKVCVLGLMPPQKRAKSSIHLDAKAQVDASDCSVISNSTHRFGLRVDGGSRLKAKHVCSAGGVLKLWGSITPKAITNCPEIADPLALRPQPSVGSCTFSDTEITTSGTLTPGTYCGGLKIAGSADVTLDPGLYIIKDGPLIVTDSAALTGTDVSFYLTGDDSVFEMTEDTSIDLSAMKTGLTAGLLFTEDQNVDYSFDFDPIRLTDFDDDVRVHKISSNNARTLLGTFYLPKSILMVDASAPVADTSAYTAIVTGRLWVREGPTLVLNADYSATSVPVPEGIASDSSVRLVD